MDRVSDSGDGTQSLVAGVKSTPIPVTPPRTRYAWLLFDWCEVARLNSNFLIHRTRGALLSDAVQRVSDDDAWNIILPSRRRRRWSRRNIITFMRWVGLKDGRASRTSLSPGSGAVGRFPDAISSWLSSVVYGSGPPSGRASGRPTGALARSLSARPDLDWYVGRRQACSMRLICIHA